MYVYDKMDMPLFKMQNLEYSRNDFQKTDARRSASVFFLQSALEISLLVLYNGKQREYVYTK